METIIFEVYPITLTSARNTLATIFKRILILFAFEFSLHIFFFCIYHAWAYKKEKKIPNYVKLKHHNFVIPKHTNAIHD